jgi:hypothetical protein
MKTKSQDEHLRVRQRVVPKRPNASDELADRLLAVLIAMLKTGKTYDPNRRSVADAAAI